MREILHIQVEHLAKQAFDEAIAELDTLGEDSDNGSSETVAKDRKEPGRHGKGGGDSADKMRESFGFGI
ncbi:hypothetical protein ACFX14_032140 [Malus domestica]